MASSGRYKVKFRRRREGKTDYYKRRIMVISGKPRLVVRFSNRYVLAQVIVSAPQGDFTVAEASSRELVKKFGWLGGTGNTPAAYLVGLLIGYRALSKGIKLAVLDVGLHRVTKGGRLFAVVKGAVDAGLEVPHDEEVQPSEDRLNGEHIAQYAADLKQSNPELYKIRFSKYLARGLEPENISKHIEEVKSKIMEKYAKSEAKAEDSQ
ncbi:50S ribosomal protein L18 [Caldivirga maquilingensis]|uniref:Large ribosomal subunit protein uL18 n=1 Tax=Caldivirga maquilingensis (strain ATCC 700844 / DSM 13496 / JCM 10307 / IC-167) TaxID=397948 RepID=RL18_CALMQ|nr:50S ribosomal protein L18 [Caldivirga maquilingensis]A8M9I3.1 RecName: Full=Large ribosomal subunit protein uL18; AltName: Full=50S ribosomal protein L18 [Caldivirga maquilingensis IC-167]ABW00864.1 ribosomal protein L18P/L5E [Caldivirga maquilingensis IC-167]